MTGHVLVVPMWNEGQLGTLEFIDAAGHKSFLPKAPTAGAWWSTRLIGESMTIGIAEGVATALRKTGIWLSLSTVVKRISF